MFIIDNNITKDDILGYLSAQLKSGQPAVIFLYELPPYLSSKIAFDKFLRAVSKYPRPITWQTHDEKIAEIITQTHKVKAVETQDLEPKQKEAVLKLEDDIKHTEKGDITVVKQNHLFVLPPSGPPDLFYPDEEIKRWENSIKRAKKVFTKEWFREQLHVSTQNEGEKRNLNFKLIFIVVLLISLLFLSLSFLNPKKTSFVFPKEEVQKTVFTKSFTNEIFASGKAYPNADFAQGKVEIDPDIFKIKNLSGDLYKIQSKEENILNIIAEETGEDKALKISEKVVGLNENGEEITSGEVIEEVKTKNNLREVLNEDLTNLKQKNESLNTIFINEKTEELKKNFT